MKPEHPFETDPDRAELERRTLALAVAGVRGDYKAVRLLIEDSDLDLVKLLIQQTYWTGFYAHVRSVAEAVAEALTAMVEDKDIVAPIRQMMEQEVSVFDTADAIADLLAFVSQNNP